MAGDELVISLRAPARAVAAGQAAVLYDGDTVLGSATISASRLSYSSPYRCRFSSLGRVSSGQDSV